MENKETKHDPQKQGDQTLENLELELETIRASLRKGKSDTTKLKILFYTSLAVLLFGIMYTNQTLQRAQNRNLESHISLLQAQVNHTLVFLEKKLRKEILELDAKSNGKSGTNFHERIQNMNQALDQLEPQSTSMGILIEKVQKSSNHLSNLVKAKNLKESLP